MMSSDSNDSPLTPVDFRRSNNLPSSLHRLGISVLISTYQAGKVISVGTKANELQIQFHHFDQAMGMACTPTGLAVGTRREIWHLEGTPDLGPKIAPAGSHDVAFLARRSHYTGPIMGHEMAWGNGELWVVNTGFSCLCTIDPQYNFVPRWNPPFITTLVPEDRCQLNGMAMEGEQSPVCQCAGRIEFGRGLESKQIDGRLFDRCPQPANRGPRPLHAALAEIASGPINTTAQ